MPSLRCLFCNHLNLAGARFCNECGSPLHLQPCSQCGAIDNRTARNCYKCGAEFPVHVVSGPAVAPAPSILDNEATDRALRDAGVIIERKSGPESAAQTPSVVQPASQPEVAEVREEVDEANGPEPAHLEPAPTNSVLEPQQVEEPVPSDSVAATTHSRRPWRIALSALMIAAAAIAVYNYYNRPAQPLEEKQIARPGDPRMPGGPISGGATLPSVPTQQIDAASAPSATTSKLGAGAEGSDKAPAAVVARPRHDPGPAQAAVPVPDPASASRPAAVSPGAATATTTRPSPATDVAAKPRQDPPIFKECPEAVAALGFCSPGTKQGEK